MQDMRFGGALRNLSWSPRDTPPPTSDVVLSADGCLISREVDQSFGDWSTPWDVVVAGRTLFLREIKHIYNSGAFNRCRIRPSVVSPSSARHRMAWLLVLWPQSHNARMICMQQKTAITSCSETVTSLQVFCGIVRPRPYWLWARPTCPRHAECRSLLLSISARWKYCREAYSKCLVSEFSYKENVDQESDSWQETNVILYDIIKNRTLLLITERFSIQQNIIKPGIERKSAMNLSETAEDQRRENS